MGIIMMIAIGYTVLTPLSVLADTMIDDPVLTLDTAETVDVTASSVVDTTPDSYPPTMQVLPEPINPVPLVPPPLPSMTSQAVITEVRLGGVAIGADQLKEYVTMTNHSSSQLNLAGWQIQYAGAGFLPTDCGGSTWTRSKPLTGTLDPHQSVTITISMKDAGEGSVRILDDTAYVHDMVGWGAAACFEGRPVSVVPANDKSLLRLAGCDGTFASVDSDDNAADFVIGVSLTRPELSECSIPPEPVTVNYCQGLRLTEIGANRDEQFIELQNTTTSPLDITDCQVQTNRSLTKSVVFAPQTLTPSEYIVITIKDSPLTLTKTTTGTVYLLSSDGKSEIDSQTYNTLVSGTSWAWFDMGWRQTYAATPGGDNQDQPYLPCVSGYTRNEETGRCNKLPVESTLADCGEGKYRSEETGRCRTIPAASVLAACKLGQYRSEETNRCRNLVTASTLTPCKEGQYRSEETNRCRNLTTASASLKPCAENQYRNEATNRCRKLPTTTVPSAAFAVEPVKEGAKAFIGWWALGGVALVAVGYAAWEWRSEVRAWLAAVRYRHNT